MFCVRDMGLDVECFGVTEINDEQVERIDQCSWKLFLLSQAMLDDVKNSKVKSGVLFLLILCGTECY